MLPKIHYYFKSGLHQHAAYVLLKEALLPALAHKSVSANDIAIPIQITQTLQQIKSLNSQLVKIEIAKIMELNHSVIMTILGIEYFHTKKAGQSHVTTMQCSASFWNNNYSKPLICLLQAKTA